MGYTELVPNPKLLGPISIRRPSSIRRSLLLPLRFFFFFFLASQSGVTTKPSSFSAIKHSLFGAGGSNRPFLDFVQRSPSSPSFMSIFEYNGSALIAMVGKNCFAIASDRRLGVQLQTIATDFQRIYKVHDRLFLGLSGLATDAQTLYQRLVFRHKLYQLREERDMKPQTFASLVSALLYEKRFGPYFCQPVIAGLGDEDKPFICTMDSIGAKELAKDFVVAGTASESLYGACEAMFKPDMEAEELFETVSQALLSSVDRDCLSGWGGHVYVVTPTEVRERILKGRMD